MGNPSADRWARYDLWDERHLSLDRFAVEDPESGFCAAASPRDPGPSLVVENGRVVEMDGVPEAQFDMIYEFIARHYFDLMIAREAMATGSRDFARMMGDVDVPRERLVKLSAGMTPAKLAGVLGHLSTLELAFANSKLRCRRQPRNRAHVTNAKVARRWAPGFTCRQACSMQLKPR